MNKLYYTGVGLLVALGLFFILQFGVAPQPTRILKPATFEKPEQIGDSVYRHLQLELGEAPLLVVGIIPEFPAQQAVMNGFLHAMWGDERAFGLIIKEPQMPPIEGLSEVKTIELSFSQELPRVVEEVQKALLEGTRVLIYTSTFSSTHLLNENAIQRLERELNRPVFSVSTAQLAVHRDEERELIPPCMGQANDKQDLGPLGCAVLQQGRTTYKTKFDPETYVAAAQQKERTDVLIFVHAPDGRASKPGSSVWQ